MTSLEKRDRALKTLRDVFNESLEVGAMRQDTWSVCMSCVDDLEAETETCKFNCRRETQ